MVLDSDAVNDDCGICKGDGTQCKKIDETFTGTKGHGMFCLVLNSCVLVEKLFWNFVLKKNGSICASAGYVKVVTIPKGARNIVFEELHPSDNTIAVGPATGNTYYLNGDL